jgi:hypothetical protein
MAAEDVKAEAKKQAATIREHPLRLVQRHVHVIGPVTVGPASLSSSAATRRLRNPEKRIAPAPTVIACINLCLDGMAAPPFFMAHSPPKFLLVFGAFRQAGIGAFSALMT